MQQTVYSSGVQVFVDYGEFPFEMEDGTKLPALGYRVKDLTFGGHSLSGRVSVEVVASDSN